MVVCMAELSPGVDAIARKSLTALLQGVERVGQKALAEGCGVDDSTITRDKAIWDRVAKSAAIAGIKFVPSELKCYSPDYVEHLRYFARRGMAVDDGTQPIPAPSLSFEDTP